MKFIVLAISLILIGLIINQFLLNHENMCDYKINLVIKLQTVPGTSIKILYNQNLIKSVPTNSYVKFKINSVNYYDTIELITSNNEGQGGFIGQFEYSDGQTIYTNKNTLLLVGAKTDSKNELFPKYSGGKYLGCYRDSKDRTLPELVKNVGAVSECHKHAVEEQYPFYGVQAYGQCFMGYDYLKAQKISDYNCAIKFPNNKYDYTGGNYANAVYSTITTPDILEFSDSQKKKRNKEISSNSRWIWIKGTGIHDQFVQGDWKFTFNINPPKKMDFCPDPNYSNFTPSGCSNYRNKETCKTTTNVSFKDDIGKCRDKINPQKELRTGQFRVRIMSCYDKIPKTGKQKIHHDFIDGLFTLFKLSCRILEKCPNSFCSILNLSNNKEFIGDCKKMYLGDRICPDNIKPESQSCNLESIDCDYLEHECKYNNYCWDKHTLKGPRCFLPKKQISDYISFKDGKILSAIDLAATYLNTKKINKTLKKKFNNQIIELIKNCTLLEFSEEGDKCFCHRDQVCYPC